MTRSLRVVGVLCTSLALLAVAPVTVAPTAQPVAAATAATQQDFITKIAPYAVAQAKIYGVYPSVMMAQAILESGWGQSALSQSPNYNLFGIKGDYNGSSVKMPTWEQNRDGTWYLVNAYFAKFPDFGGSFAYNGQLLRYGLTWNKNYYEGTWYEKTSSYRDALTKGLQGHYATALGYATSLDQLITTYNLTRYDPQITAMTGVVTVKGTAGLQQGFYGPAATVVKNLAAGSRWQVVAQAKLADGTVWYEIGTNQWVSGTAVTYQKKVTPTLAAQSAKPAGATTALQGTIKVTTTAGTPYYNGQGQLIGKTAAYQSAWKTTLKQLLNGQVYYRIGQDVYLKSSDVDFFDHVTQAPKVAVTAVSGVVKVNRTTAYVDHNGNALGKQAVAGTRWATTVDYTRNGDQYYRIGRDIYVAAADVTFTRTTVTQAPKIMKTVQTLNHQVFHVNNYATTPVVTATGVTTNHTLAYNSRWQAFTLTELNGQRYVKVGENQYVLASAGYLETAAKTPATSGVVTVTGAAGAYTYNDAHQRTLHALATGTAWKYQQVTTQQVQGQTIYWFKVGAHEWLSSVDSTVR